MQKIVSIVEKTRQEYIDRYLESAKRIDYTDLTQAQGCSRVLYEDLPDTEMSGYPVASDFVTPDGKTYSGEEFRNLPEQEKAKCKLRYSYLPFSHELYVGATGSGKTTGCVEPQLRAISHQKNKPNLFLTDPKGELFDHNAQHLKDNGYRLFVLNFKELTRSDKWNPFLELYNKQLEQNTLGKSAVMRTGKVPDGLDLHDDPAAYHDDAYIEYDKKAFCDGASLDAYLVCRKDELEAELSSMINQFANMFVSVENSHDPTWEYGAQELVKGLLQCMLEDASDPEKFTRDMMTIKTLSQYYQALRVPITSSNESRLFGAGPVSLYTHPLTRKKAKETLHNLSTALHNAPNTMRCYCGVFDSALKDWFQGHIFSLTTGNTIDFDNNDDAPFAIFVITRDYDKSDFKVAGLFIDWVYRNILQRIEKGEIHRPLHFLLDEFANIPRIQDLENKIATSRSRNIWFHLVVQSYNQIDRVYGAETAAIIKDNCNTQAFLGAQNRATRETFSAECGKHSIPSFYSMLKPEVNELVEVPLLPVSALDTIRPGEIYYKRMYLPLISTRFVRSYIAAAQGSYRGFFDSHGLKTCTPRIVESFNAPRFTYPPLLKDYLRPEKI